MNYVVLLGRILYSLIFLFTIKTHFSEGAIGYALAKGVPMANILVPASGVLAFIGGLSILLGFKAKWGAICVLLFLIPVTLMMHDFWNVTDAMQKQMQHAQFMKNLALIGAALMITYFGSGPLSVDARMRKV